MHYVRPSVRLIALLVYALAVNAFVWASTATARPSLPGSITCHALTADTGRVSSPAPISAAHTCCDLACTSMAVFLAPTDGALIVLNAQPIPAHVAGRSVAVPTLYRPNVREPPLT